MPGQPRRPESSDHPWSPRVPFRARLCALQRELQRHCDRRSTPSFTARVAVTGRLRLDQLAQLLPPAEARLLAHLRARKPLTALDGTPGFRTVSRRNEHLQRLLSRINVYCGSAVRHRLMQPYDRPGHRHRPRRGRRRRLIPADHFPQLRLWVSAGYAHTHRHLVRRIPERTGRQDDEQPARLRAQAA
ncbi:MAG TPA: hypothetical protein VKW76_00245 [Candidatus Binatia bacterium]|nr:hypothetical protein [Candidatus Binatia bacterium]